ncbi:MAG: hypothetical protein AAF804_08705 [Bacteroidota bacterium]
MTSVTRAALSELLSQPIWERLEAIEQLAASIKQETPPTPTSPPPPDLSPYFGALKGVFGDGLAYQKRVRSEWD